MENLSFTLVADGARTVACSFSAIAEGRSRQSSQRPHLPRDMQGGKEGGGEIDGVESLTRNRDLMSMFGRDGGCMSWMVKLM